MVKSFYYFKENKMFEQNKLLYKVSPSTGKTQIWKGFTDGDKICVTFGQTIVEFQTSYHNGLYSW